jgi:Galactose oxidase, central domain
MWRKRLRRRFRKLLQRIRASPLRISLRERSISLTVTAIILASIAVAAMGATLAAGLLKVDSDRTKDNPVNYRGEGSILIAGGYDSNASAVTATAELYDPATRQFYPTGEMTTARVNHTATLLKSGKVLIAGGANNNDPLRQGGITDSAELYDPVTGKFTATGSMNFERVDHAATLLPDGRVLIVGGVANNGEAVAYAEVYNPDAGTFAKVRRLTDPRVSPTTTLMENGEVLITGGEVLITQGPGNDIASLVHDRLNTAEIYSSRTATFNCLGGVGFLGGLCNQSMSIRRIYHTATLLKNGRVLIAGGDGNCLNYTGSAELYDPKVGAFVAANDMVADRQQHTATLLNDGRVLLAGGLSACKTAPPVLQAELYEPDPVVPPLYAGVFSATGTITEPRDLHRAVLLPTGPDAGSVLIAGGSINGNATAELYVPASGDFECVGGVSATPPVCNPTMMEARQGHTATLLDARAAASSQGH